MVEMLRMDSTDLRASLMWVSMTREYGGEILANRGDPGGKGLDLRRAFNALTGQRNQFSTDCLFLTLSKNFSRFFTGN